MHMHVCPYSPNRSGILQCFDLKLTDFNTQEEANNCANHFIAQQRAEWSPEVLLNNPDQLCEGSPCADLFWFSNYKGKGFHIAFICKALSPCRYRLPWLCIYIYIYIHVGMAPPSYEASGAGLMQMKIGNMEFINWYERNELRRNQNLCNEFVKLKLTMNLNSLN